MASRETLLDFFGDLAAHEGGYLIHDDGYIVRSYSYPQTVAASHRVAHRLIASGLKKGDRILIYSENRPEWIPVFWGALLAGIVVVPLDYRSSRELLKRIQEVARASLLVAGSDVEAEDWDLTPVWRMDSVDWNANLELFVSPAVTKDETAEILFTSGATAEPKGVVITHRNILANIVPVEREVAKYRRYGKPFYPLAFLNLLPLSHMFGQAMAAFIPPLLGGVVVFLRGYNPRQIVRLIAERKVSVLVCVPKILEVLREHVARAAPEARTPDPSKQHFLRRWWKYRRVHRMFGWKFWAIVVGAAPLEPELEEYWGRLGYLVIQGYGLTETAPIVTLNHPFHTRRGAVGKPIGGVEVKISEAGEILVRGENVTTGYLNASGSEAFQGGWFHTGDVGTLDAEGRLYIRGRKKEMIVTPEGLNVFPEDVERALLSVAGVKDVAVVGSGTPGSERVHAVLILEPGSEVSRIVRETNTRLEDHQKIRGYSLWPGEKLPRTEGTEKLKRRELRHWVETGQGAAPVREEDFEAVMARFTKGRTLSENAVLEDLGLTSLERIELLMALETQFDRTIDEGQFTAAQTVGDLRRLAERPETPAISATEQESGFPHWTAGAWARAVRRVALPFWLLPMTRVFAKIRAEGLENLEHEEGPLLFAPNHQSHLDVPVILAALPSRWRYRIAPAMSREFFDAHFAPGRHTLAERFWSSLGYYLAVLFFQAFPLSQRGVHVRETLRYTGELLARGRCPLIFPEGHLTDTGEIGPFQPGIGVIASRLRVRVVPVRLEGLEKVLHRTWRWPSRGPVRVTFLRPMLLEDADPATSADRVRSSLLDIGRP